MNPIVCVRVWQAIDGLSLTVNFTNRRARSLFSPPMVGKMMEVVHIRLTLWAAGAIIRWRSERNP